MCETMDRSEMLNCVVDNNIVSSWRLIWNVYHLPRTSEDLQWVKVSGNIFHHARRKRLRTTTWMNTNQIIIKCFVTVCYLSCISPSNFDVWNQTSELHLKLRRWENTWVWHSHQGFLRLHLLWSRGFEEERKWKGEVSREEAVTGRRTFHLCLIYSGGIETPWSQRAASLCATHWTSRSRSVLCPTVQTVWDTEAVQCVGNWTEKIYDQKWASLDVWN